MPRPSQPWELPPPEHRPVPGNPYAAEGFGPPVEPPRRRRSGRVPLIAAAVVLLLLAAGGGVYAVTDGRWGGSAAPAAPAARKTPPAPETPSAPPASAVPAPEPKRIPTSAEINAGRKPGEATAWVVDDRTDLPGRSILLHDLWVVGDTVVQAMHRKVTAYRLSDGAEVWSVPLPAPVCETPVDPTPDGKVVVVYKNSQAVHGNRCNQLQMIDLRTGKAGWQRELTETGSLDDTIIVHTAISGDVLAVVQGMTAAAYRVGDGTALYDIPMENPGKCYPDDVAGGPRLLVSSNCAIGADRSKSYSQLREIDPRTGKVHWRFRTQAGWKVARCSPSPPSSSPHSTPRTSSATGGSSRWGPGASSAPPSTPGPRASSTAATRATRARASRTVRAWSPAGTPSMWAAPGRSAPTTSPPGNSSGA
ncbi:PQQ-binding-like beta-propeller repeat protein [Streptomyces microflavus]|uniref:outer membrane protein assembly factor BamB family protein n=1 Tax=Streptomyces microflavus TaxID=1919 RepID=UPI003328EAC9